MYINDITKEQLQYNEVQALFPNSSLPIEGTEILADDWYLVHPTNHPVYDQYTQSIETIEPIKTDNTYNETWQVMPLSAQEIEDILVGEQLAKIAEINNYSDQLIIDANANPQLGMTVDPKRNEAKSNARRNDNANKQAGDIVLDTAEKDQAKIDQKLSEYVLKIYADNDKAVANMYKLTTSAEVVAFDVPAQSWTVWTPPL